jgi:hypothetical protein
MASTMEGSSAPQGTFQSKWDKLGGIDRYPEDKATGKKSYKGIEILRTDDGTIAIQAKDSTLRMTLKPTKQEMAHMGLLLTKLAVE